MARDFAKGKSRKTPARKKPAARRSTAKQSSGLPWRSYLAGVVSGIFISFLAYLAALPQPGEDQATEQGADQAQAKPPKPRFDFYTKLPKQRIEDEVEPAPVERAPAPGKPRSTSPSQVYLLQAGSFRQREDADRRRAELLLLGLEPNVEETNGDNGRWYRVYLGPFENQATMSRARGLTAGQNIDTLVLKRERP